MTRPIFEPTPQRQISNLGYFQRQLLRRPSPVQAMDWAWMKDESIVIDGSTYGGATVFQSVVTEDTGVGSESDPTVMQAVFADDIGEIQVHAAGIFLISFTVQWQTAFASIVQPRIVIGLDPSPAGTIGDGSQFPDYWRTSSDGVVAGMTMFFTEDDSGSIQVDTAQYAGVGTPKTIFASTVKVVRLQGGTDFS